jgi:hydroxyacylglutathione hydrolase
MLLKRLYDDKLAQASYLIACQESSTALIVDPLRDVDQYLALANEEKVRITDVTETHVHADFVSGARDLARETGARLHLSDMGGDDWKYGAINRDTDLLRDGSSFMVGCVRIDVLHTPGHTPEHLTFLVTDTAAATAPVGAFTGDFIFVGDVGRPDLLERAAGIAGTKEAAAHDLFRSLQKFKSLPDYLQLWPGHGAGSACGKALGAMPSTTVGYEKLFNWGLTQEDEEQFVREVLSGQPDPPAYFAVMKRINRDGPPPRRSSPPPRMSARDIAEKLAAGALVVDTRPATEFAERHAESSISLPYTKSFLTYGGAILPYDRDVYLIAREGTDKSIVDDLALIGIDRVGGVYPFRSIEDLESAGIATRFTPQVNTDSFRELVSRNGRPIIDVRGRDEWQQGHIPHAVHIPLGALESRLAEIPKNADVVVHCQSGARAGIASSILQKNGISVSSYADGLDEWERVGGAIERDTPQT